MASASTGSAAAARSSRSGSAGKASPVPHTRIEDEQHLEDYYEFGKKLGQGSFGIVREVMHRDTGSTWACKVVNKEKAGSSAIKLLEREVAILKSVQGHDHIIKLKEVYETPKKMYLVMELCEGGELADMLKEQKIFSEEDTKKIMVRLTNAISYLHKNDMVHRDIKLENILMSKNPNDCTDNLFIKLTDFGLSVVKGGVGHENMMMDFCGTPMYMSPEIIDNKTYSEKCDIWAMGVIMFILLCGSPPFQSKDEDGLYEIIKTVDVTKLYTDKPVWQDVSDEAKDFIHGMLTIDPAHRLTASELLDHPWITGKSLGARGHDPRNVLEMMKAWRDDLQDKDSDDQAEGAEDDNNNNGAINGESATPPKPAKTPGGGGAVGSRPSSSSTGKKGKVPSKDHSTSSTSSTKSRIRNSSESSVSVKHGKAGVSSLRPNSRSPVDKDSSHSGLPAGKARSSAAQSTLLAATSSSSPAGRVPSSRGAANGHSGSKPPPSPLANKKKR